MGYLQHPVQQGEPPCVPTRDGLQPMFRLAAWFIQTPGLAFITHSLLQQLLWPFAVKIVLLARFLLMFTVPLCFFSLCSSLGRVKKGTPA